MSGTDRRSRRGRAHGSKAAGRPEQSRAPFILRKWAPSGATRQAGEVPTRVTAAPFADRRSPGCHAAGLPGRLLTVTAAAPAERQAGPGARRPGCPLTVTAALSPLSPGAPLSPGVH
ncbi:hypothetical protein Acsp02_05160 [Actinoplanes sp. NBRC 103695]|nr:hypothetical protein Acsp02_05160 [Actinoplanes sp. NBRC 103695]